MENLGPILHNHDDGDKGYALIGHELIHLFIEETSLSLLCAKCSSKPCRHSANKLLSPPVEGGALTSKLLGVGLASWPAVS